MDKFTARELIDGLMEGPMPETGIKTSCTVKVCSAGKTAKNTKEATSKIKKKVREH